MHFVITGISIWHFIITFIWSKLPETEIELIPKLTVKYWLLVLHNKLSVIPSLLALVKKVSVLEAESWMGYEI